MPRSTTNAVMPFFPAARSVTASTTQMSATLPFVMNIFVPLSTHASPSRTAVVRMPPASEPVPGSVSPQQPTFSPFASGVRNRLLLLLAAGQVDVRRGEAVVRGEGERDARVDARHLLHHDRPVDHGQPGAAVLRRASRRPASPSSARVANISRGKRLLLVPLARRAAAAPPRRSRAPCGGAAPALRSARSPRSHGIPQERPCDDGSSGSPSSRSSLCRRRGGVGPRRPPRPAPTCARSPRGTPARTRLMDERDEEARAKGRKARAVQRYVPLSAVSRHLIHAVALLRGPELLRPRGRRLEGDPGVDRERRAEATLRARRQHDHPAAREEPLLRHRETPVRKLPRARSSRAGSRTT